MKAILDWLPLVWTVRIGLLIVLAGAVYVYVLLVAPFFRWSNIRNMVFADLPRVASVGGEFAGAKAEVAGTELQRDTARDDAGTARRVPEGARRYHRIEQADSW